MVTYLTYNDIINDWDTYKNIARPNFVAIFSSRNNPDQKEIISVDFVDEGLPLTVFDLLITDYDIPSTDISFDDAKTTFKPYSITVNNSRFGFTNKLRGTNELYLKGEIQCFFGFSVSKRSNDDFRMLFDDYIKTPFQIIEGFDIKANEVTLNLEVPWKNAVRSFFNIIGELNADLDNLSTEIDIDTDNDDIFLDDGYVKVNNELIEYNNKQIVGNITRLTIVERGSYGTQIEDHNEGSSVNYVLIDESDPVTLIRKLLQSNGSGGLFDVYYDGIGLDDKYIFGDSFDDVRDDFFFDEIHRIFIYDIDNIWDFMNENILFPNNLRLVLDPFQKEGLTIIYLKDITLEDPSRTVSDSMEYPSYNVITRNLANTLNIKWAYNGIDDFKRNKDYLFQSSIDSYSNYRNELEAPTIQVDLNGSLLAIKRSNEQFLRYGSPQATLEAVLPVSTSTIFIGDIIRYEVDNLTSIGSIIKYSRKVLVLSKQYDHKSLTTKFSFIDYPYSVTQEGAVFAGYVPNEIVTEVIDNTNFRIPNPNYYEIGYKIILFSIDLQSPVYPGEIKEITDIQGDLITIDSPFSGSINLGDLLTFPDYTDITDAQKDRYASYSDDSNNFPDGRAPYEYTY